MDELVVAVDMGLVIQHDCCSRFVKEDGFAMQGDCSCPAVTVVVDTYPGEDLLREGERDSSCGGLGLDGSIDGPKIRLVDSVIDGAGAKETN